MGEIIIESERLILRKFTTDDSEFIIQLLNTDGWIKYIGDRNIKTTEQAINYLNSGPIKSYEVNGFGLGLVALKNSNTPIGMCGLIKRDSLEYIDIGFAFLPEYMNQGYGFEIAKKTLQYGFEELHQDKIVAITLPTNFSSIKLLEKIGLRYEKSFISKDTNEELFIYGITREDKSKAELK